MAKECTLCLSVPFAPRDLHLLQLKSLGFNTDEIFSFVVPDFVVEAALEVSIAPQLHLLNLCTGTQFLSNLEAMRENCTPEEKKGNIIVGFKKE